MEYNTFYMPEPGKKHIPQWAQKERSSDLRWIQENLHALWPAASAGYEREGRGALIIDTTLVGAHESGMGNPMYYLTQPEIENMKHPDALRMVREYDPTWEFVAGLLKLRRRDSFYRVGLPHLRPKPR